MLSERKDFQECSSLIHGNGSPNECSSHSAASMTIPSALIRQVGWMRATCSIFKGQLLFRYGTGLTKSHEKASYSLCSIKTVYRQSSICNSSSPTPSLPKQKWKDKKPHRTKKRCFNMTNLFYTQSLGFSSTIQALRMNSCECNFSFSYTNTRPALHNHNQIVCLALCNILKTWRNV